RTKRSTRPDASPSYNNGFCTPGCRAYAASATTKAAKGRPLHVSSQPHPEISVIIPARNEESSLANCLRSLADQEGPSYEIIVVDDHSTDATHSIAESFPVRVISADPLAPGWSGKCNAVWTGAKAATGKWLLFTDADT